MSALTATSGEPQSVGDPGQLPPTEFLELIGETVDRVRALALYELLRLRLVREIPVASPAAGAEWTITVPAGAVWEILSVRYRFVASAVVANRFPMVDIKDVDSNSVVRLPPGATTTASATTEQTLVPGYGDHINLGVIAAALPSPPLIVPNAWAVASSTVNIDAGDAYSRIFLTVREWSVGQVYWAVDLIGRELGFEHLNDLPASTPLPEGTGQPIPVSPLAR